MAEVYFAKGDFANAQQTVTALQQYPELANYCTLFNILLDLQQQNKSVFDIKDNPTQYQAIIGIAADSLHAGYSGARTILTLIDEKQYSEVIRFDTPQQLTVFGRIIYCFQQEKNYCEIIPILLVTAL